MKLPLYPLVKTLIWRKNSAVIVFLNLDDFSTRRTITPHLKIICEIKYKFIILVHFQGIFPWNQELVWFIFILWYFPVKPIATSIHTFEICFCYMSPRDAMKLHPEGEWAMGSKLSRDSKIARFFEKAKWFANLPETHILF